MPTSVVPAVRRKYTRLSPSTWAETEALWQIGEVTLADLAQRYGVSPRALQARFHKRGIVKGEKSAAVVAAVKEEVFKQELDDVDAKVKRAKDVREAAYSNAVVVEDLIMAQLQSAQKDPSQALRAASAIKMLSLAAAGLERLHSLKHRALGLDNFVEAEELPELVIRVLTDEAVEEIQTGYGDDPDELEDLMPATNPEEADEIVVEDGEDEGHHAKLVPRLHQLMPTDSVSSSTHRHETLRVECTAL